MNTNYSNYSKYDTRDKLKIFPLRLVCNANIIQVLGALFGIHVNMWFSWGFMLVYAQISESRLKQRSKTK